MKHIVIKTSIIFSIVCSSISCSHKSTPTVASQPTPVKNETATGNIVDGQNTYNSKCGSCHTLVQPSEYSAHEWVPILRSMCRKAKLDEIEKANVTAYVMSIAK